MKTTFNYEAFKQGFREAAWRRNIDPETGEKVNEYKAVLLRAELRHDLHYKHLRDLVTAAAQRQVARGTLPSEGRGFFSYDADAKDYVFDQTLVDKAQAATWWQAFDPQDWKPGEGSSMVECQAMASIRRQIAGKRGADVMTAEEIRQEEHDVVREVIEEDRVIKSQKQLEMSLTI